MTITTTQLKEIRQEFAALKPASVTLDGNRTMSVKEAVFALAPTLERMKKRGFGTQEIIEKLHEKGIEIKPQTLNKYLAEARRQRGIRKIPKKDHTPTASAHAAEQPQEEAFISFGEFRDTPAPPLEDL